jgi:hypothetical protein
MATYLALFPSRIVVPDNFVLITENNIRLFVTIHIGQLQTITDAHLGIYRLGTESRLNSRH